MLITVKLLNEMSEHNNSAQYFTYRGQCYYCGRDVEVEITKTSGGYGLQGGVLCGSKPEGIFVCCIDCQVKNGIPN